MMPDACSWSESSGLIDNWRGASVAGCQRSMGIGLLQVLVKLGLSFVP
jgi:hypothetical protein